MVGIDFSHINKSHADTEIKKILIIEPEKSLQRNILTLVETEGFYGLAAADGQQGLQLAFAQRPDLILCDTQVPKLDGLSILQRLKYDPAMAQIPFLLLTDKGDRTAQQQALALGASYALSKPLKMANLRDTIVRYLGPAPGGQLLSLTTPVFPLSPALDLLQQFFDSTSVAIGGLALFDSHLRFVAINETFAQLNGYPVTAYMGRRFGEVLPAVAPIVEPILQQIFQTGQPILKFKLSGTIPNQPTHLRHWLVSYVPIIHQVHQPPSYVAAIVVEVEPTDLGYQPHHSI